MQKINQLPLASGCFEQALCLTKGASTLTGRGHATLVLTLQNPNAANGYTIFRRWYVTVYVNECNYPITWNIAEQARELDRARRVDEWTPSTF